MPIPILMYHKVGQPVHTKADRFLNVSAESFRRQMWALARLGYRAYPFAEVVEALRTGKTLAPRACAITFDDGYSCVGETTVDTLKAVGFPATVFVVSDCVGKTNAWDRENGKAELPLMGWEELGRLQAAGWEMAGHTRTHPHLDSLEDAEALAEIREGKLAIEGRLATTLRTFCYPYGHFQARTPLLVKEAGFLGACTTRSGLATPDTDPYLLPRVKVGYRDGLAGFLYRLLVRPHLGTRRAGRRDHH